VDKNVLIQYVDMKEEIKDLRRRIHENERELAKLENMIVTDSVTRGKRGKKPLGTVKITGRPTAAIALKQKLLKKRNDRLTALEAELLELTNQAEEYIETIPKSELRIMFRLYYIDDLTWYQVALQMNQKFPKRSIKYTEDNCRMRHNRFLEKLE
jgi:chromatin segregation and condensation protein Rec8/ScpA/Scc1 (kleisin family)